MIREQVRCDFKEEENGDRVGEGGQEAAMVSEAREKTNSSEGRLKDHMHVSLQLHLILTLYSMPSKVKMITDMRYVLFKFGTDTCFWG